MALRLYVVHNSHPCAAVEKGMQMKGIAYKVFEWPPPMHSLGQQILFGARTVPALKNRSEKLSGSRAIMHRLDEMVPEPPLYPSDPDQRARVEAADAWGDEQFQQIARDLIWVGAVRRPDALVSYSKGGRVPTPGPVVRGLAPWIARIVRRINRTDSAKARMRMQELPGKLDRIDAWIADGTIGDAQHPNAADLQILSTIRLLYSMADVRPLLDGRPCLAAAQALWPAVAGVLPAGALAV
jgi:glutathione S-transferase